MKNELDKIYKKYKKETNMTFRELKIWSQNPKSNEASLDRKPITRNLKLLGKRKADWTTKDIQDAKKSISYLRRAKKIKRKQGVPRTVLTPNEIALRNWGFDVFKK